MKNIFIWVTSFLRFLFFFIVGFFIYFVIWHAMQPSRSFSNGPKACYANMRVILGAVEMYNMDNEHMLTTIDAKIVRQLYRKGYFKTILNCPDLEEIPPNYKLWLDRILGRDPYATATDDIATTSYFATGDLTKDGKIACRIHGTVDD